MKLIHKILSALDNNSKGEILAVIANLNDWSQAFDLQCPKLGLNSFIRNGVRPGILEYLSQTNNNFDFIDEDL